MLLQAVRSGSFDKVTVEVRDGAIARIVPEGLIVSRDTVVGRWRATGTHTGQLPGLPPTGKPIAIGSITIYRIADGKIIEAWEQLNMLGMWQQLGVVSLPGHE